MKRLLLLAVTLVVTGFALPLSAQDTPRRGPGNGGQPGGPGGAGGRSGGGGMGRSLPLIKAVDTDADGALSAAEIAEAPKTLKTLDKNSDGKLSSDELNPDFGGRGGGGPGGPNGPGGGFLLMFPAFTALDTDKDGALSAGEIEKAPASLLTLDKDKNGVLAAEELRPNFGGAGGQRPRRTGNKPQRPPYED